MKRFAASIVASVLSFIGHWSLAGAVAIHNWAFGEEYVDDFWKVGGTSSDD